VFGPTDANEPIPSLVLPIPINDDNNNELNESFKLTLEVSADGRAANVTEGSISMTVVLIKDDDGKLNNTVQTQRYISAYFALCGSMRGWCFSQHIFMYVCVCVCVACNYYVLAFIL